MTMKKRFLIVVDMQNDFIDGSLGTPEAQGIVPAVVDRVGKAREDGETVIATMDTHEENYLDTREGRYLPVRHCIRGTEGWRIRPEVAKLLGGCVSLEKPTFGSMNLFGLIHQISGGEKELAIELVGLCTDICVISNALILKTAFPEADIIVRRNCCAGSTPEKHEAALQVMASCQIDVI
jgi:nicotinamidase-related amidase